MLFDMRGRRQTGTRWIYGGLAALMAVGFVGFGVGSDAGAGLFGSGHGGGGGHGGSDSVEDQRDEIRTQLERHPGDAERWRRLTLLEAQAASDAQGEENGRRGLRREARAGLILSTAAYERYRDIVGERRVEQSVALSAARSYAALDMVDRAMDAQRIAVRRGGAGPNGWFELAQLAAANSDIALVDRALRNAVRLVPEEQREAVRSQRDELMQIAVRAPIERAAGGAAFGAGGPGGNVRAPARGGHGG